MNTRASGLRSSADVCVMGAGIMGCCLALELANRGVRVDLVELAPAPMTGASLHNEGKLHLGFVYANDPHKETHRLMLQGSLTFSDIIKQLTGFCADDFAPSQPFQYYVPQGSLLDMDALEEHFSAVQKAASSLTRNTGNLYLGKKISRYYRRNTSSEHNVLFSPDVTLGSFQTEERSISPVTVAKVVVLAIKKQPRVHLINNTRVLSVDRLPGGEIDIEMQDSDGVYFQRYSCAVNCLWDDKIRVDATAGIDDGPWIFRYKATINVSTKSPPKARIPSATGVLGAYGDVVNHGDGSYYISWYPLCKLVQKTDQDGRRLHELVHKGFFSGFVRFIRQKSPSLSRSFASYTHRRFVKRNILEMANYIPAMSLLLHNMKKLHVGGGVILARGATDIDDPQSYLHQRSAVGPVAYGSYLTIDTGKYCTAPLFAQEAADTISAIL